ncbi:helix-turn-helix domain-containing protein [Sinomonas atrocyanea]|uniref:helix-turn-helix domain-containing protein n=1 Tax=Sinomonas atrocyanea TaxID=37927 RepID=UPI0008347E75|nr:LysR family transcriptional regulator [Sinomonas atrocyanea]
MSVQDWELRHYRFLAALAAEGSIGGAARAIGMAQPNASRLLEQMERQAGFPLARRTPQGTRLTDRGRVIAGLAAEVVGAAENVGRAVGALEGAAGPCTCARRSRWPSTSCRGGSPRPSSAWTV